MPIGDTKPFTDNERRFIEEYLLCLKPYEAAIKAGYSETTARAKAFSWVSQSRCPPKKQHVRDEIKRRMDKVSEELEIDAKWVLKRAALLANFSLKKFVTIDETTGLPAYDFRNASDDDWYCLEELTTQTVITKAYEGELIPIEKIKIKTTSKTAALKLVGECIGVDAFRHNVHHTGNVILNVEEDDTDL